MRRLAFLICLLALASPAAALPDVETTPRDIWIGQEVQIDCFFEGDPGEARAWITEPIVVELGLSAMNSSHFSTGFQPPVIGRYLLSCGDDFKKSQEKTFTVSELEVELVNIPDQAYSDQGIELGIEVIRNSGEEEDVTSGVDFTITLDGEDIEVHGIPYFLSDHWVVTTGLLESFGSGSHTLVAEARHDGVSGSDSSQLDISGPLEFSIISVSPDEIQGGENITVKLSAKYHGEDSLAGSQLSANLDGQGLEIFRTADGFWFTCPDLDPESHEIEVVLSYEGEDTRDSSGLYFMIPVSGEIRNADGGGISASMKFIDGEWQKTIKANVNGYYLGSIPAGVYDLEISFPDKVTLTLEDFRMDQELEDFIRFDSFKQSEIDGIRAARIFGIELSADFDEARVRADYDGAVVDDEAALELYHCDDWNLDTRSCQDGWDDMGFEINEMQNWVEFETREFSGFVIGERGELHLELRIDRADYLSGQEMRLDGVVRDENDKPIHGVEVEYSVLNGPDGDLTTNTNGIFSARVKVPEESGTYSIIVKASKGYFEKDSETAEFIVMSVSDFKIIPPLKVEVTEGSEAQVEAMLVNTGQETLEDCKVSLSGIPEEWYEAFPEKIDYIDVEQEKVVKLRLSPDSADLDTSTVSIDVDCDQISRSESFVLYVSPVRTETKSQEIEASAIPAVQDDSFDSVTTYLTGSPEALLNTISLMLSGGLVLIILRKLRSKGSGSRDWLIGMLTSLRGEVLSAQTSPKRARPRTRKRATRKTVKPRPREKKPAQEEREPIMTRKATHIEIEV